MAHINSSFDPLYSLSKHTNSNYNLNDIFEIAFNQNTVLSGDSSLDMINFIINTYTDRYSSLLTVRDIVNIMKVLIDVNIHRRNSDRSETSILFFSMIESFIEMIIQLQAKDFMNNGKRESKYIIEYLIDISFIKQSLMNESNALKNKSIQLLDEYYLLVQNHLKEIKSSLYWYCIYLRDLNSISSSNNTNINKRSKDNSKTNKSVIKENKEALQKVNDDDNHSLENNTHKYPFTSFNPNLKNNIDYNSFLNYNKVLGSTLNYSILKKEVKLQFPWHQLYIIGSMRYGIIHYSASPIIDILILSEKQHNKLLSSFKDYHLKLNQISKNNSGISLSYISFNPRPGYLSYSYSINSNGPNSIKEITLHIYFYNKLYRKTSMIQSELYSFTKLKQLHLYAREIIVKDMEILQSSYDLSLFIMHFLDYKYKVFKEELHQEFFSFLKCSNCADINNSDNVNKAFESKVNKEIKLVLYKELNQQKLQQLEQEKPVDELIAEFLNYFYDYMKYISIVTKGEKCSDAQIMMFEDKLILDEKYLLNRLHIDKSIEEIIFQKIYCGK